MNEAHLEICASPEWAEAVERWIVPWVLETVDLGDDGLASDSLAELHLDDTYVPVDPATLAERLTAAGFTAAVVDTNEYAVRFRATKP
jgi:hypothetical protein